jgi:hypothetical protein
MGQTSDEAAAALPPYEFDRYADGRTLMAEGIGVTSATTLKQAIEKAARMAYAGDVLVYRPLGTEAVRERAERAENEVERLREIIAGYRQVLTECVKRLGDAAPADEVMARGDGLYVLRSDTSAS